MLLSCSCSRDPLHYLLHHSSSYLSTHFATIIPLCHCCHVQIMTTNKCVSADLDNRHPHAMLAILAQHATLDSVPHCHAMLRQVSAAHRWYCVLEVCARRFFQHEEGTDDLVAYLTAAACVAQLCTTEHNNEDQLGTGPFCLQVEQKGSYPVIYCGISCAIGVSS